MVKKEPRPSSAVSRTRSAHNVHATMTSRPKSAVSGKSVSKKPAMKLIFGKSEPSKLAFRPESTPPAIAPIPTSSTTKVSSSKKVKTESKSRDFGSLGFYLDSENFGRASKKRESVPHGLKSEISLQDQQHSSRTTFRRSLTHTPGRHGDGSDKDLPAALGESHLLDPQFIRNMRNTSYAFPGRDMQHIDRGEMKHDDLRSARRKVGGTITSSLSDQDWRTVSSATIYPYHRR